MALKTQPTKVSVRSFLDAIPDEARRRDCKRVASMMAEAGVACLYIKRLSDVDLAVLDALIRASVRAVRARSTGA